MPVSKKFMGVGRSQIKKIASTSVSGLPSGVQGDVLYHNGADWTVLNYGTANQVLTTNGASSNPSWTNKTSATGIVGGTDTMVQFNDGGSTFGGVSEFTFTKTTNALAISSSTQYSFIAGLNNTSQVASGYAVRNASDAYVSGFGYNALADETYVWAFGVGNNLKIGTDNTKRMEILASNGKVFTSNDLHVSGTLTAGTNTLVATDTLWTQKGDLVVGTGSDTAIRLASAAGDNGQVLTIDTGETSGLKWADSGGVEVIANYHLPVASASTGITGSRYVSSPLRVDPVGGDWEDGNVVMTDDSNAGIISSAGIGKLALISQTGTAMLGVVASGAATTIAKFGSITNHTSTIQFLHNGYSDADILSKIVMTSGTTTIGAESPHKFILTGGLGVTAQSSKPTDSTTKPALWVSGTSNLLYLSDVGMLTANTNTLTAGYVPYVSGATKNGVGNSVLYNDATNSRIGINTASPNRDLDVRGTTLLSGNTKVVGTGEISSTLNVGSDITGTGTATLTTGTYPNIKLDPSTGTAYIKLQDTSRTATTAGKQPELLLLQNQIDTSTHKANFPTIKWQKAGPIDALSAYTNLGYRMYVSGETGFGTINADQSMVWDFNGDVADPLNYQELMSLSSAGALTINRAYTLPTAAPGSNGYVITGATDGTTAWVANTGGGGGTSTYWSLGASSKIYYNSGNVGIGEVDPDAKLHVRGTTLLSGTTTITSGSTLWFNDAGTAPGTLRLRALEGNTMVSGATDLHLVAADDLALKTGGGSGIITMSPDSSELIRLHGADAMIGTTAALGNGKLTIVKSGHPQLTISSDATNYSTLEQAAGTGGNLILTNHATTGDIRIDPNDDLWLDSKWVRFYDEGTATEYARVAYDKTWLTEKLSIYDSAGNTDVLFETDGDDSYIANGNFGLGTTEPATLLHLSGSDASEPALTITSVHDGANGGQLIFDHASASPYLDDLLGTISFKGRDTSGSTIEYSRIVGSPYQVVGSGGASGVFEIKNLDVDTDTVDTAIRTFGCNTNIHMGTASKYVQFSGGEINSVGTQFFLNYTQDQQTNISKGALYVQNHSANSSKPRVGLGTTSPEAFLDVSTGVGSDTVAALKLGSNGSHGWHFYDRSTDGDLRIQREVSTTHSDVMNLDRSTGDVWFYENVGIGTTDPEYKLDVRGITLLSGNTTIEGITTFNDGSANNFLTISETGTNNPLISGTGDNLYLSTVSSSTNRIYFAKGGVPRLRIGLPASGGAETPVYIQPSHEDSRGATELAIRAYSSNVEIMRFKDSALVGLGTTAPAAKLDIVDTTEQLRLSYDADEYATFTVDNAGGLHITGTNSMTFTGSRHMDLGVGGDRDFRFNWGGDERVTFLESSNLASVGINRTAPDATLDVRGTTILSGTTTVHGTLSATAKSFDIPHPDKKGMRLIHGSLEGPEHGVYVRGTAKGHDETTIELPDYWETLVGDDYTLQLTSYNTSNVYIVDKGAKSFTVNCNALAYKFDYFVIGRREEIEVEIDGN